MAIFRKIIVIIGIFIFAFSLFGCKTIVDNPEFVITFETNGGNTITSITLENGSDINLPVPVKEGHTFEGWYTNSDLTDEFSLINMPLNNLTLYAKWQTIKYTITFETNGGSLVDSITQDFNSVLIKPADPIKEGFIFSGWFTDSNFTSEFHFTTMPSQNSTVYAKWSTDQYSIFFDTNGGNNLDSVAYGRGQTLTLPTPVKEGNTFIGWYYDLACTLEFGETEMPGNNLNLYAKWEVNQYTITFDSRGGSSVNPITGDFGRAFLLPTPTKEGQSFGGWFEDEQLTIPFTSITIPSKNLTLYAKWTVQQIRITFNTGGGNPLSDLVFDKGSKVNLPTPTKDGNTFLGWYVDLEFKYHVTDTSIIPEDVTLYAKWNIPQFVVSFNSDGGNDFDSVLVDKGNTILSLPIPEKIGYTFMGWFTGTTVNDGQFTNLVPVHSNLTLYARWKINQYTISFETNGGNSFDSISADFNSFLDLAAPIKEGHSFVGWFLDNLFTEQFDYYVPANSIKLYAKWKVNQYEINYITNCDETIDSKSFDYGTLLNLDEPNREWYSFLGWFTDETLSVPFTSERMPSSNLTLYAKWAFNDSSGLTYVLINNNTEYEIAGFTQVTEIVQIPKYYNGKLVTSIGDNAFSNLDITRVIFEDDHALKRIGANAFNKATKLIEISLPYTVDSIGAKAFNGAISLTNITIPNNVTFIGSDVFLGATSLMNIAVVFDNSIYCSVDGVLYYKDQSTLIKYPEGKTNETYELPSHVKVINSNALSNSLLKEVVLINNLTSIGTSILFNSNNLVSITMPGNYTLNYLFGNYTEYISSSLERVTITDGSTDIVKDAFLNVRNLKEINLPSSIITIGENAFSGVYGLTTLFIPSSVTFFGLNCFYDLPNLERIDVDPNNSVYTSVDGVLFNKEQTELIIYPAKKDYTSFTVPSTVTTIANGAFMNANYLTELDIPSHVVTIGTSILIGANNLQTITQPGNYPLKYFYGNNISNLPASLTTIHVASGTTSITTGAFSNILSLKTVHIPNSVTSIGLKILENCRNLETLTMPGHVTLASFFGSTSAVPSSLKTVNIAEGSRSIANFAFEYAKVTTINIPSSVLSIGYNAFRYNYYLTSLTMPGNFKLASIFGGGNNNVPSTLTDVAIAEGSTTLASFAFSDLTRITRVSLPNSLTSIGNCAFYGSGLTELTIPSGVTTIGNGALSNTFYLTKINVSEDNAAYSSIEGVLFDKEQTTIYLYPAMKPDTSYVVPSTVTTISNGVLSKLNQLTELTIPTSVTMIDTGELNGTNLVSLTIPGSYKITNLFGGNIPTTLSNVLIFEGSTSIIANAFENATSLVNITIPSSVTSIGDYAFNNTPKLTQIVVDENNTNFTSVEGVLFNDDLTTLIQYPASKADTVYEVQSTVTTITTQAFMGAKNLINLTIPNSVTDIGSQILRDVTNISTLTIPGRFSIANLFLNSNIPSSLSTVKIAEGSTELIATAFGNWSFIKSITIPVSVTSILRLPGLPKLESITVDSNNEYFTTIDGVLFDRELLTLIKYPAKKTDSSYIVPSSITTIQDYAFSGATNLTEIVIPSHVTKIGNQAFLNVINITSLTMPGNLTLNNIFGYENPHALNCVTIAEGSEEITANALTGATNVTLLNIPSSVSTIGENAFDGLSGLSMITVDSQNTYFTSIDQVLYTKDMTQLIKYPAQKQGETFVIPNSVTTIKAKAFEYASLSSIVISSGVTNIEDNAFSHMTNLSSFEVDQTNSSYTSVEGVLYDKAQTVLINYPAKSTNTTYVIPNTVTSIRDEAFFGSTNLLELTIPSRVTTIGSRILSGTTNLTTLTMPGTVTLKYLFGDDSSSIPSSLKTIIIAEG